MAAKPSQKVGRGFCPFKNCSEPVTYRRSSGGKLTFRCEACDRSGYAEPGGSGHKDCLSSIPGELKPVAAEVQELVNTPPPAPHANSGHPQLSDPVKRKGFSLDDL